MKEIVLDNTLVADNRNFKEFDPQYFFKDSKGFESVTAITAEITHMNYLMYLSLCWERHYGAVISPTILWNMVLNNLAYKVNKTPDVFRKYFSESDEKQEISVMQSGNLIDVKLLIDGLQGRIPTKILEDSFPNFSTDTEMSKIANYTAFLDMVSPYYNYSMYMCGIPKVKVLGTPDDWEQFMSNCEKITLLIPEFGEYLMKVRDRIILIADKHDVCDYSQMFRLEKCGSGSQVEVEGWITEFFIEQPSVSYPENFISCISKIDYHNYNDEKDYRLYAGLFTSTIVDGYLIPEFGNMYFLKKAIESKSDTTTTTVNLKHSTKTVSGDIRITENDFSEIIKQWVDNETFRIIDGNKILIGRIGKNNKIKENL
jgi:hypothetical protein